MTHLYDDTTLTRAVLLFGPLSTEHQFIRAAAKVNRAAGILTDALMRLQENLYPSTVEIENAITDLKAVLPGLYVAAEQVAELTRMAGGGGIPFNPEATAFTALRCAELNSIETLSLIHI